MISIRNLSKSFGDILVFNGVNLDIEKGDSVVIIGGSGCGKSTLLRCINHLETPDDGQVYIDGEDIYAAGTKLNNISKKIGMVYQHFNLFSHLNVLENMILAPMKVNGVSKDEAIKEALKLLDMVGMKNKAFAMPSELSGGQKQRVAIARALAMKPEVMLFDEPTSALDPTMVDEVENVIRTLIKNGMTCVIVTHEMRFAKKIASKVVFLAEQGIYEYGTADEVFNHPSRPLTRQFLYRSLLLEKNVTKGDFDFYATIAEIRTFALQYGLDIKQSNELETIFDELIYPILNSYTDIKQQISIRFVANETGSEHKIEIEFPHLEVDPLKHPSIDTLGQTLLKGLAKNIQSFQNKNAVWEVHATL